MELTELDETSKRAFSQAKERFKMAREKATDASNNEALGTYDCITAIRYRVVATILETTVEAVRSANELSFLSLNSALKGALPECEQCLEKPHSTATSLPAVRSSLKVELDKGPRAWFSREERRETISAVYQVNRAIYDVTQAVGRDVHLWIWPFIDTGEDKVDPLRDGRVTKVLRKLDLEHFCVTAWSFGQEGEEEHKLKGPMGIVTNTHGQFIVADHADGNVIVFDSSGKFLCALCLPTDNAETYSCIADVATDGIDNTYVLIRLQKLGVDGEECDVLVFDNTVGLHHKFRLGKGDWAWRLTVNSDSNRVLVLRNAIGGKHEVDMHESDGRFVRTFGEGVLKYATDITAANDGRAMVGDRADSYVHVFSKEGEHLFNIDLKRCSNFPKITFHWPSELIVVAGDETGTSRLRVLIYTKGGEFVRGIQLDEESIDWLRGITVTMEVAVAFKDVHRNKKVLVL